MQLFPIMSEDRNMYFHPGEEDVNDSSIEIKIRNGYITASIEDVGKALPNLYRILGVTAGRIL